MELKERMNVIAKKPYPNNNNPRIKPGTKGEILKVIDIQGYEYEISMIFEGWPYTIEVIAYV